MSTDAGEQETKEDRYRKMITCPVCMMYCPPPLQTCSNGHITCGSCLQAPLHKCPVCRVKIDHRTAPRNLLFEEARAHPAANFAVPPSCPPSM